MEEEGNAERMGWGARGGGQDAERIRCHSRGRQGRGENRLGHRGGERDVERMARGAADGNRDTERTRSRSVATGEGDKDAERILSHRGGERERGKNGLDYRGGERDAERMALGESEGGMRRKISSKFPACDPKRPNRKPDQHLGSPQKSTKETKFRTALRCLR